MCQNRPKKISAWILGVALLLAPVFFAVDAPVATAAEEIRIGFVAPVSGGLARLGEAMKHSAEIAVQKVNAAGGLEVGGKKYRVKLVVGDSEGLNIEKAVAATMRVIERDQVHGIVGMVISSNVLAAIPLVQQMKTPLLNVVGKSGGIPKMIAEKKMDYIFQVSPTNDELVASHGGLISHYVKPKKIVFIGNNTDAARDYLKRAENKWPKMMPGLNITGIFVEPNTMDFQAHLLRIRKEAPDLIYVLLVGANTFAFVDQFAATGLGKKIVVLGDSDYGDPAFPRKTAGKTELHLGNAVTFEAPITNLTVPYFQDYKKKAGQGPPYYAVQQYDGMLMMFEGIRRAGNLTGNLAKDREAIKNGLSKITKDNRVLGVRGRLFFSPVSEGRRVPADIAVVQFKNKKAELIWPRGPAAKPFTDPRK